MTATTDKDNIAAKNTMRVLLIEDDDAHAELVQYAMESGYPSLEIQRFRDGEDAWQYLSTSDLSDDSERPRLMLVDINMPKLGGLDLLARVKSHSALRSIPAVVLTTSSSEKDRQKAGEVHANSYLVKPMSFEQLSQMMKTTLEYWAKWNLPTLPLAQE